MPIKTASAARSIQCRARTKRRRTGVDDIKTLTVLYQIKAVAKIRPIIRVISQAGVADVTAVAKTEINKTTALGLVGKKIFETKSTSRTRTALFRDVRRGGRRKDQAQAQKSDKPRPTSARPRLAIDIALALLTGPAGSTPHTAQTNGKPNVVQIPALVPLVIDERTTATKIRTREYERGNEDAEHAGQNKHGTQFKVFPTRRRCRSSHGHRNNAPRGPAYSSAQCGRCGADL